VSPLHLIGMHGLGDNLHQRGIVRQLMQQSEIWLETPWPCVYHDMVGSRLHLIGKTSFLRTQAKNARRERASYEASRPPRGARSLQIHYRPEDVRSQGSVLGAMAKACGVARDAADFRLTVPARWLEKADALLAEWRPSRPIMLYRPLVERSEWGGCPARNPDKAAYRKLFASIRARFFVVSIADLEPGKEWLAEAPTQSDVTAHKGEFDFETIAALAVRSSLIFTSPGFAAILAQAVGTPGVTVFGGYENSSSFSGGARFAPTLGIDPMKPCNCFSHTHRCRKDIDLAAAQRRLLDFVNATADHRKNAA
jgi:hypothetical protein